jgi:hypothetical protein
MQKANKISAFFFLGLFSLIMLHQAFPHLHHQHEDSHSHSGVAHPGDHHHHHENGSGENEDSPYGFFDFFGFFMDMHVHSASSGGDIFVLKRHSVEQLRIVAKDVTDKTFDVAKLFLPDIRQIDNPATYHPPNTYFNPSLSCLDLRGPPALG